MQTQKKSRRTYLIYPQFQLSLIGLNVSIILGISVPILASIIYSFRKLRQMGIDSGIAMDHVYFKFLALQEGLLKFSLGIALACGIVISILLSIFISHKIAGPIVRLKSFFRSIPNAENKHAVQFRKGDFFSDLPEEINRAIERLKKN